MLEGLKIVVTRPRDQADNLIKKLKQLGADVTFFPTIEITPTKDDQNLARLVERLDEVDLLIFISRNAVRYSEKLIKKYWPVWPSKVKVAAIGQGTAEELEKTGFSVDFMPEATFNSESLLEIPEMNDVMGKTIIIVRGEDGKELLGNTLRERGANVCYAETYRRLRPDTEISPVLDKKPDVIITTSSSSLQNLYDMTPSEMRELLLSYQLLVVSSEMVELADHLGFSNVPIIATGATDDAILKALV
jgi:uroporphyrinogen-III synthase